MWTVWIDPVPVVPLGSTIGPTVVLTAAMCEPSGENTGNAWLVERVCCSWFEPSAFAVKTWESGEPGAVAAKTIFFPSDDQLGVPAVIGGFVRRVVPVPSLFIE